jgi:hypothetical protein
MLKAHAGGPWLSYEIQVEWRCAAKNWSERPRLALDCDLALGRAANAVSCGLGGGYQLALRILACRDSGFRNVDGGANYLQATAKQKIRKGGAYFFPSNRSKTNIATNPHANGNSMRVPLSGDVSIILSTPSHPVLPTGRPNHHRSPSRTVTSGHTACSSQYIDCHARTPNR